VRAIVSQARTTSEHSHGLQGILGRRGRGREDSVATTVTDAICASEVTVYGIPGRETVLREAEDYMGEEIKNDSSRCVKVRSADASFCPLRGSSLLNRPFP
jgi:hypothetical protein